MTVHATTCMKHVKKRGGESRKIEGSGEHDRCIPQALIDTPVAPMVPADACDLAVQEGSRQSGRRKGSLLQGLAVWGRERASTAALERAIAFWRLVLGVGVGGVYPLSATVASESAESASRGRAVALVFSTQGIGALTVPLVAWLFVGAIGVPDHGVGSARPRIAG